MLLLSLLRRSSEYVGHHTDEHRAPKDTPCVGCDKTEPGTNEEPVFLAECSVCKAWRCTACFTMHRGPDSFYSPPSRRAWWLRMVRPRAVGRG